MIFIFGYGTSEGVSKAWDTRGRGRKPPEAVGFASPNVEENLTFKQALAKLNTPEEEKMLGRASELLNSTFGGGEVHAAVGDWSDGAENSSVMYSGQANRNKMDYVMATLGKEFNQKAVISFVHDENGSDWIHTMNTAKGMDGVRSTLDKLGIQFRTLIPEKDGTTTVQVFDQGGELAEKSLQAASALDSGIEALRGNGNFIGGDSREDAQKEYAQIIRRVGGVGKEIRSQGYRYVQAGSPGYRVSRRSEAAYR